MRKNKFIKVFIICLSIFFIGCSSDKNMNTKEKKINIISAKNLVENYMTCLVRNDYNNIKKMYSKKLSKDVYTNNKKIKDTLKKNKDVNIKTYKINETFEMLDSATFRVRALKLNEKQPYTSLEEYNIKVNKEDDQYKIDEIKVESMDEAFLEGNKIKLRNKNNVDTDLVLTLKDVPKYSFSKDDAGKLYKQYIPNEKFGNITLGYEENKMIISTEDKKDTYVALVNIERDKATQGGQQGGKGAKGQQPQGEKPMETPMEKPIGKEIMSLDILKDSKIQYSIFSNDEQFIVIQYVNNKKNYKCLRTYNSNSGDLIKFNFEEKYPLDKVDIIFSSFEKDMLNYEVVPKNSSYSKEKEVKKIEGKWRLDLKKNVNQKI